DEGARNDRIAGLRDVIALSLDEEAGAVGLDVEDTAGWNQLAARDFDRSRRAVLRHHPAPAAPPTMTRPSAPPPPSARSAPRPTRAWSRTRSRHGHWPVASV